MAEPIGYTVSYDFEGWQALNPTRPLPADMLDAELGAVETGMDDLIACLQTIRRADGLLQNGIVTYDSLDDQVKVLVGASDRGLTTADLDPAAFASQPAAEAGAANDKLMTPLRTKQAITAQRAYALQAEAEAGAEPAKVMSPLLVKQALDAMRAWATVEEAEAGVIDDKVLSPLTGREEIEKLRPAKKVTVALTWSEIEDGGNAVQDVVSSGAVAGDRVGVGVPAAGLAAGLILDAWVSAADTVKVRILNLSGGALTPVAGNYTVTTLRF